MSLEITEEKTSILTIDEVKTYLTIDDDDSLTEQNITRFIKLADETLKGSIGDNYSKDDERAKQLALFIVEDLYDRGNHSIKEQAARDRLRIAFTEQLKNELRSDSNG